ncbi:hypothetical protein [Ottowia sp. VDI28]|uniref:hypothetical protein n=1 Tax=Ottowia sp. VDI28 TaxID=3133968 RepID=UPI003C2FC625
MVNKSDTTSLIRAAGGIVHGDGNIFFKSAAQFIDAASRAQADEWSAYLENGETTFEKFMSVRNDADALQELYMKSKKEVECLRAQAAQSVPEGWREKFSEAVYEDLAAADNQDVPLEEYPARILKVLDSIVGPRHPTVVQWRNDAIRACIEIVKRYGAGTTAYQERDMAALITAAPSAPAPEAALQELVNISQELGLYEDMASAPAAPAAPAVAGPDLEAMRHRANEWADMAINGLQWLRNIVDGISDPKTALENMESNLVHCREVDGSATQPTGVPAQGDAEDAARYRWCRSQAEFFSMVIDGTGLLTADHAEADAAIDAAIVQTKESGS